MEIWVEIRWDPSPITEEWVEEITSRVLRAVNLEEAQVSISVVGDDEMARLNGQYLGRPWTTNVMAFSQVEGEGGYLTPNLLGDVVICGDTCLREAEEAGMDFRERFLELLVHGILHLLGRDHEGDERERNSMEKEEETIVSKVQRDWLSNPENGSDLPR